MRRSQACFFHGDAHHGTYCGWAMAMNLALSEHGHTTQHLAGINRPTPAGSMSSTSVTPHVAMERWATPRRWRGRPSSSRSVSPSWSSAGRGGGSATRAHKPGRDDVAGAAPGKRGPHAWTRPRGGPRIARGDIQQSVPTAVPARPLAGAGLRLLLAPLLLVGGHRAEDA